MKKIALAIILSLPFIGAHTSSFAQQEAVKQWVHNKCTADPFNDDGKVDCNMFTIEVSDEPLSINKQAIAIVRIIRLNTTNNKDKTTIILQLTSRKSPPKIVDGKSAEEILVRIDKNPVQSFPPRTIFIQENPDQSVFQSIPLNKDHLREMLDGKNLHIRYTAKNNQEVTQNFTLNKFLDAFIKTNEEFNKITNNSSNKKSQPQPTQLDEIQ